MFSAIFLKINVKLDDHYMYIIIMIIEMIVFNRYGCYSNRISTTNGSGHTIGIIITHVTRNNRQQSVSVHDRERNLVPLHRYPETAGAVCMHEYHSMYHVHA